MVQLLHLAHKDTRFPFNGAFREQLEAIGKLTIVTDAGELEESERLALIQSHDILLTAWGSAHIPTAVAFDPGCLRYVCNITGTLQPFIPIEVVQSGIPVTNWGDAPADLVAEGAMTLLLAVIKDLQTVRRHVQSGGWGVDDREVVGGTLRGLRVGIYGMGVIGRRFIELIQPFGSILRVFDPYVTDLPTGCKRVSSLTDLFASSEAIVIHAGLTDQTRHSITADLLALLPNHGLVINTARGGIIDQDALFAELESGRLRAGLDVLDEPDFLNPDDRARTWDNLLLTNHQIDRSRWPTGEPRLVIEAQRICLENIGRFLNDEPLKFVMDEMRYRLST